jgi:MFS family permease
LVIAKLLGLGFGLLGKRDFRELWIGNLFSNTGTFMMMVSAAWLMTSLTTNSLLVALVQTALSLPFFILGIPGGVLTDLFNHKKLLIITQAWMILAAGSLALLAAMGKLTPWLMLGLLFLIGMGVAIHQPAWKTLLQDLVTRDQSAAAVSLNSLNYNITQAVGPILGGVLMGVVGPAVIFGIKALSYVSVIVAVWRVPEESIPQPKENVSFSSVATSLAEGWRFLGESKLLAGILIRYALFVIPGSGMMALLPLEARREIGTGVLGYGTLLSSLGAGELLGALGMGTVAGALFIPSLKQRFPIDKMVSITLVIFTLAVFGVSQWNNMLLDDLFLIIGGVTWSVMSVSHQVSVQFCSPDRIRGRTTAFYLLTLQGSMALGSFLFGWIAQLTTISESIMLCGVLSLFGLLLVRVFPLTNQDSAE